MTAIRRKIGFTCSYTPLPLIRAAGFDAHRILPLGEPDDQAGGVLHDNLCPHVKKTLDRLLAGEVPELAGLVVVNSCDTMRRLADAVRERLPELSVWMLDLPTGDSPAGRRYLAGELERLAGALAEWGGQPVDAPALRAAAAEYDALFDDLARLALIERSHPAGAVRLQRHQVDAVTLPLEEAHQAVRGALATGERPAGPTGVPIYLFGNVLPDPNALEVFAMAGARVAADDLCTGENQLTRAGLTEAGPVFEELAGALLARRPCARTFTPDRPGSLAELTLRRAREVGAVGVVAHVLKFCDPYLARMTLVREALREAGLPLLVLEGDCSLRSLGQQRTRIEAFVEMLQE